jgi:uncharacterized oligopeptide transporter (OPT) family protein
MTGGGNMAALGALLMITTVVPSSFALILWFGVIAALGVFAAIPFKRQLVDEEQLAFPTGTATAEKIRSIHDSAAGDGGSSKAKWLGLAALFGAVLAFLRDAKAAWMPFNIPASLNLPGTIAGRALKDWTLSFKIEVVLLAAGALMSFRTGWSLLLGGLVTYAVLAPSLVAECVIQTVGYKGIVVALLIVAGVFAK